jgi:hypothetical protein
LLGQGLKKSPSLILNATNTLALGASTTDSRKHFLGFQISIPGQNLSLSISEAISGDTQTQVDTLKHAGSVPIT